MVHSYAATCIERLLAQREHGKPRFTPDELAPLLQPLLEKLFAAFKMPESGKCGACSTTGCWLADACGRAVLLLTAILAASVYASLLPGPLSLSSLPSPPSPSCQARTST